MIEIDPDIHTLKLLIKVVPIHQDPFVIETFILWRTLVTEEHLHKTGFTTTKFTPDVFKDIEGPMVWIV
jgi:hypothetical protein